MPPRTTRADPELGAWLRAQRVALGFSTEAVANACWRYHQSPLSWDTLAKMERGERPFPLQNLHAVANVLGITDAGFRWLIQRVAVSRGEGDLGAEELDSWWESRVRDTPGSIPCARRMSEVPDRRGRGAQVEALIRPPLEPGELHLLRSAAFMHEVPSHRLAQRIFNEAIAAGFSGPARSGTGSVRFPLVLSRGNARALRLLLEPGTDIHGWFGAALPAYLQNGWLASIADSLREPEERDVCSAPTP